MAVSLRRRPALFALVTAIASAALLGVWLFIATLVPSLAIYVHTAVYPHEPALAALLVGTEVSGLAQPQYILILVVVWLALLPVLGYHCAWPPLASLAWRVTWQTAFAFALGGTVATQAAFELAESGVSVNEIEFLAGAAQVSAAIVATVRTRALRPAHGTIAAFITGAIVLYVNITGSRS